MLPPPFAGTQLTVEIHPQDAMPQLLKKFSLAKRKYRYRAAQIEGRPRGWVSQMRACIPSEKIKEVPEERW